MRRDPFWVEHASELWLVTFCAVTFIGFYLGYLISSQSPWPAVITVISGWLLAAAAWVGAISRYDNARKRS